MGAATAALGGLWSASCNGGSAGDGAGAAVGGCDRALPGGVVCALILGGGEGSDGEQVALKRTLGLLLPKYAIDLARNLDWSSLDLHSLQKANRQASVRADSYNPPERLFLAHLNQANF